MRVLLVEDDTAVRKAFTKILDQAGFTVTAVANGVEAFVELKKSSSFDVVVSDFAMPGMEGTTFFEHLGHQYPALALRVVFVTGYGNDEKTRKLLEHTGRPYLAKPVDIKDFLI